MDYYGWMDGPLLEIILQKTINNVSAKYINKMMKQISENLN